MPSAYSVINRLKIDYRDIVERGGFWYNLGMSLNILKSEKLEECFSLICSSELTTPLVVVKLLFPKSRHLAWWFFGIIKIVDVCVKAENDRSGDL